MKHGDKAKAKKAKSASKASDKKSSKASSRSKAVKTSKAVSKAVSKSAGRKSGKAPILTKAGNDGANRARSAADVSFSNPVIANAFKRAVKKYPNAFRRLTD